MTGVKKSKWAGFSSIFVSALVLFVIGLEPYIPAITEMLPVWAKGAAGIILPAVIIYARRYNENGPIKVLPKKK